MLTAKDLQKYHQAAERILNAMDNSSAPVSWREMDRLALQNVIAKELILMDKEARRSTKKKKTYRIVRGDTLCGISRKKYKTESKWRNIYNANKKVIEAAAKKHGRRNSDNGHWIYPGTVLTLP